MEAETSARRLAKAAASTHWRDVPSEVQRQALDLIADTFAVIAAGAQHESLNKATAKLSSEAGPCTVIGHASGASANTAGLINGMATTVLQLQDGHRMARGHPISHVLPAAFAVAEEMGASVEDFLSAVVAGYEVCARAGRALGGLQALLHDTGTFGTIGAAVATAFLLAGRDPDVLEQAIEGSAAVALFPYRHTPVKGATVHHLYVGLGVSNGVTAGKSAVYGLTSLAGTLEDFFGPRAGADFNEALLIYGIGEDGRWSDYELMQAYFKLHPTCAHLNGVNDAVLQLIRSNDIEPETIAAVDVGIYSTALEYNNSDPVNDLAARFSIRFVVAIALQNGRLGSDVITDEMLSREDVIRLASRIDVRHDPALDAGYPAGRPSRVSITLHDGTVLTAATSVAKGDAADPLTADERREKVRSLIAMGKTSGSADEIIAAVDALPERDNLSELGRLLRAPTL